MKSSLKLIPDTFPADCTRPCPAHTVLPLALGLSWPSWDGNYKDTTNIYWPSHFTQGLNRIAKLQLICCAVEQFWYWNIPSPLARCCSDAGPMCAPCGQPPDQHHRGHDPRDHPWTEIYGGQRPAAPGGPCQSPGQSGDNLGNGIVLNRDFLGIKEQNLRLS